MQETTYFSFFLISKKQQISYASNQKYQILLGKGFAHLYTHSYKKMIPSLSHQEANQFEKMNPTLKKG